jgi:ParB/RepB/Spo0J family partition protein
VGSAVAVADVPRGTTPRPVVVLDDILLELIDVGDNVRVDVGELAELAASIAELGVLDPVKVTKQDDGRYRLVWGQRRVLASRIAGKSRIPAIIQPAGEIDAKSALRSIEQLSENLQRKDLNAIEEAIALREVLDANPDLTQAALAKRLGMSAPWVSNTLRLLDTHPTVQDGVRSGTISASHAKALVVLPAADQQSLAKRIVQGMSAHALENEIGWKVDEVKRREQIRVRTDKAVEKAVAALDAAKVAKDVQIILGYSYNLDNDRVSAAIKKAGWKIGSGSYGREPGPESKCDCQAVHLAFERTWQVKPACVDVRHVDRQTNADHVAEEGRRKRTKERLGVLSQRVAASLAASSIDPMVLRLAFRRQSHHWTWDELIARPDVEVISALAEGLADTLDPTYVYPVEKRVEADQALEDAIAALPAAPSETTAVAPDPKSARAKKAANDG